MRLPISPLLLASLSGVVAVSSQSRKSLSFGPRHPSARLRVPDQPISLGGFAPGQADPREVAARFVEALHAGETQFVVRDDSYTDKTTGVSHVYVRQVVNGLEVMDGDVNVNVFDGEVISFGDSFYRGPAPEPSADPALAPEHDQSTYCAALNSHVYASHPSQLTFNSQPPSPEHVEFLDLLKTHNCPHQSFPPDAAEPEELVDPRISALNFMILAHPSPDVAFALQSGFDAHLDGISNVPTSHLTSSGPTHEIHDVPHSIAPISARLAYVQTPSDDDSTTLSLVWHLTVPMEDNAYEAFMSATHPRRLISVVDWVSDAYVPVPRPGAPPADGPTYNVWPWGINDPSEGNRSLLKGHDQTASPVGWHAMPASAAPLQLQSLAPKGPKDEDPLLNFTTTWGNNVFAHENFEGRNDWENNRRPDGGKGMEFDYAYLPEANFSNVSPKDYLNLSVTQLFYTSNMYHDLTYRYGFDEASGNFQQSNFGKGGKGGDAVIANAQDGSGYNNANFMTPPDGSNGRMRMYVWNTARPWRDGDLEAGIVIHELSHGLSTRLTGGPANSACLGWGESGGMGEGWGDFLATTIRSTSTYEDYAMGAWAANRPQGIRNFVYSLNMTVNPSTYKTLDKPGYWGVHAIGEVWAQTLWVVSNRLIKVHGFTDSLFPPEALANGTVPEGDFYRPAQYDLKGKRLPLVPKHGNSLAVQLVINAMKLQPCRPSFFDARDAIIQADTLLTGGENTCELWRGFSERGLGPNATLRGGTPWGGGVRTDDFTLPSTVCGVDDDDLE